MEEFKARYAQNDVMFIQCDVTDLEGCRAAVKQTVSTFGRLDIMVNNAGVLDEAEWQRVVDVNVVS